MFSFTAMPFVCCADGGRGKKCICTGVKHNILKFLLKNPISLAEAGFFLYNEFQNLENVKNMEIQRWLYRLY